MNKVHAMLMKKISRCFIFFFQCMMTLVLCSSQAVGSDDDVARYIDPETGVVITCEAETQMFPVSWLSPPVSAKATSLKPEKRERCLRIVREELKKYPPAMLHRNLQRIYIVENLLYYDTSVGGFGCDETKTLYLGIESNTTDRLLALAVHHEFSHILFSSHATAFSRKKWEKLNPTDFRYPNNGLKGGYTSADLDPLSWTEGFSYPYGKASIQEDTATLSEAIFAGEPHFWQAVNLYPVLKKKVAILVDFYHSLDKTFTPAYFRQLIPAPPPLAAPRAIINHQPGEVMPFVNGGRIAIPGNPFFEVNVPAGGRGIYAKGSLVVGYAPKTDKPSLPDTAPEIKFPSLPAGYFPLWSPHLGWLVAPKNRAFKDANQVVHLRYQPGDKIFFADGGLIYRAGQTEAERVPPMKWAIFSNGANVIFDAPSAHSPETVPKQVTPDITSQRDARLLEAVKNDNFWAVKALLLRGANANARDSSENTALVISLETYPPNGFFRDRRIALALIQHGADVNARMAGGRTALMRVLARFATDDRETLYQVKMLLKHKANVRMRDEVGWTPLHIAVNSFNPIQSSNLLDHGARVNERTEEVGQTPLMVVANYHGPLSVTDVKLKVHIVNLLLKRGAKINLKDSYGKTALDLAMASYAEHEGDYSLAQYLVDRGAKFADEKGMK